MRYDTQDKEPEEVFAADFEDHLIQMISWWMNHAGLLSVMMTVDQPCDMM